MGFAVDDWICELEQQFAYYNRSFPDDASRIKFAVAYLHGPAVHWWDKEPAKAIVGLTWDEFLVTLRKRYRPVQASMLARQRLDKLRQRTGQIRQRLRQPVPDDAAADRRHERGGPGAPFRQRAAVQRRRKGVGAPSAHAAHCHRLRRVGGGHEQLRPRRHAGRIRIRQSLESRRTPLPARAACPWTSITSVTTSKTIPTPRSSRRASTRSRPAADSALIAVLNRMDARVEAMEHRVLALAGGSQSRSASSAPRRDDNRVPGLKAGEIDQLRREKRCFRCKGTGHFKTDPKCPKFPKSAPRSVNW